MTLIIKIFRNWCYIFIDLFRLMNHTNSAIVGLLKAQNEDLYLKEFFLEPQLITQPSGVAYTIKFTFKDPSEPGWSTILGCFHRCCYYLMFASSVFVFTWNQYWRRRQFNPNWALKPTLTDCPLFKLRPPKT